MSRTETGPSPLQSALPPCPARGDRMHTPSRAWWRHVAVGLLLTMGALPAIAQTPFVPYFGKNEVRYDNFRWAIYTTDHFEIYYYPETEQHLERIASYAESAYQ